MASEQQVRAHVEAGQIHAAVALAVTLYGREVHAFLVTLVGPDDADDAFQDACADVLTGLPRFEWKASLRTWFYVVARNAATRRATAPHRRPERRLPLSDAPELEAAVRTATAPHLRTDVKDAFAAIRAALAPDDRALLYLRVDRELSWNDIAHALFPDEAAANTTRVAARLRKRFQTVKDDVRERAVAAGLLG